MIPISETEFEELTYKEVLVSQKSTPIQQEYLVACQESSEALGSMSTQVGWNITFRQRRCFVFVVICLELVVVIPLWEKDLEVGGRKKGYNYILGGQKVHIIRI